MFDPGANLQLVDMVPIQEGQVHSYTLTSSGGALSVVLVWYDYPADPNSKVAIVNDLDLAVQVVTTVYIGQARSMARKQYQGNGPTEGGGLPDRRNTVERVEVQNVLLSASIQITVGSGRGRMIYKCGRGPSVHLTLFTWVQADI